MSDPDPTDSAAVDEFAKAIKAAMAPELERLYALCPASVDVPGFPGIPMLRCQLRKGHEGKHQA